MRLIDLFAGWGGFTVGARAAGARVVWAANHSPIAVAAHAANHPDVEHACQDLRQADWTTVPAHDGLLASPACQGHSTASQPRRTRQHDADRSTAWAVVDCADVTRPRAVLVENVPSFRSWVLYPVWRSALEALGYRVVELLVTASRHGVPQRRTRLFVAGVRTERAARAMAALDDAVIGEREEPAFGPCIDWGAGTWRPVARTPLAVRRRIETARRRHGPRCLSQHVTGHGGVPLSEPIRTITAQDQWVIVDGDRYRPLTVRETARAMGFPDGYACPEEAGRRLAIKGFGLAVSPPVARALVERLADVA